MKRRAVATEPADLEPVEIVTAEQAAALAAGLAPGVDASELQADINEAGTLYRWFLHLEDRRQPAPVRAELAQLSHDINAAIATLDGLGEVAERKLDAAVETDDLQHGLIGTSTCRAFMVRLRDATEQARAALPRGDGHPGHGNLRQLCARLAAIYERFSGERFKYDAHGHDFLTPGARWVERVAKIVDPEITGSNLVTAMRGLPKPRRK